MSRLFHYGIHSSSLRLLLIVLCIAQFLVLTTIKFPTVGLGWGSTTQMPNVLAYKSSSQLLSSRNIEEPQYQTTTAAAEEEEEETPPRLPQKYGPRRIFSPATRTTSLFPNSVALFRQQELKRSRLTRTSVGNETDRSAFSKLQLFVPAFPGGFGELQGTLVRIFVVSEVVFLLLLLLLLLSLFGIVVPLCS